MESSSGPTFGKTIVSVFLLIVAAVLAAVVPRWFAPTKQLSYSIQEIKTSGSEGYFETRSSFPTVGVKNLGRINLDSFTIFFVIVWNSGSESLKDIPIRLQLQTADTVALPRELFTFTSPPVGLEMERQSPNRGGLPYQVPLFNPGEAINFLVAVPRPVGITVFSRQEGMRFRAAPLPSPQPWWTWRRLAKSVFWVFLGCLLSMIWSPPAFWRERWNTKPATSARQDETK